MYSVTVVANEGELTVEVTVTDVEEDGEVTVTRPQPQVEVPVDTTHDDDDGEISSATWQWARSSDMAAWTDITNATSMSYSPAEADVGRLPSRDGFVHGQAWSWQDGLGDNGETRLRPRPSPIRLRPSRRRTIRTWTMPIWTAMPRR